MSPDGTVLVLREDAPQSGSDLLLLPLAPGAAGARERVGGIPRPVERGASRPAASSRAASSDGGALQPLIQTMFAELNAELSPDGRWIAINPTNRAATRSTCGRFPTLLVGAGRCRPVAVGLHSGHATGANSSTERLTGR